MGVQGGAYSETSEKEGNRMVLEEKTRTALEEVARRRVGAAAVG